MIKTTIEISSTTIDETIKETLLYIREKSRSFYSKHIREKLKQKGVCHVDIHAGMGSYIVCYLEKDRRDHKLLSPCDIREKQKRMLLREQKESYSNAEQRNYKDYGFENGEQFVNEVEPDGDLDNTLWDQGFLMGIKHSIRNI